MNASTVRLCNALWTAGNSAGNGFAPDGPADDVNAVLDTYRADGGTIVYRARTTSEVSIVEHDSRILAIGDANGAWAVDITAG